MLTTDTTATATPFRYSNHNEKRKCGSRSTISIINATYIGEEINGPGVVLEGQVVPNESDLGKERGHFQPLEQMKNMKNTNDDPLATDMNIGNAKLQVFQTASQVMDGHAAVTPPWAVDMEQRLRNNLRNDLKTLQKVVRNDIQSLRTQMEDMQTVILVSQPKILTFSGTISIVVESTFHG